MSMKADAATSSSATSPSRSWIACWIWEHRAIIVLFGIWPLILIDPSGPPMTDSVLLAAIRIIDARTWTLSDVKDPSVVSQTVAFDIAVYGGRIYSGVGIGAS